MNNPTADSAFSRFCDRLLQIAPNTTSSEPEQRLKSTAHAPCSRVFRVSCCSLIREFKAAVTVLESRISGGGRNIKEACSTTDEFCCGTGILPALETSADACSTTDEFCCGTGILPALEKALTKGLGALKPLNYCFQNVSAFKMSGCCIHSMQSRSQRGGCNSNGRSAHRDSYKVKTSCKTMTAEVLSSKMW